MLISGKLCGLVLIVCLLFCFISVYGCDKDNNKKDDDQEAVIPQDGRFNESAIARPNEGYIDSIFINAGGNRIYFLHSKLAPNDFLNGTINYPEADLLPGHTTGVGLDWNTDLYYVEWDGASWSGPENLGSSIDGSNINSLASECCVWLNESETEIIFYRENLGLPALGDSGNYISTRSDIDDPWDPPVLMASRYGALDQSEDKYRHDIQKTASNDLYLWEQDASSDNNSRLLYGQWNGTAWLDPVTIPGTDSVSDETQPWVSVDELTLIFNRRGADANTSLIKMTRSDSSSSWGNLTQVALTGFADPADLIVWGEPTLPKTENYMLYIRFDTSVAPWNADIMFAPGSPGEGFGPPVDLNL